jgi:putative transposase
MAKKYSKRPRRQSSKEKRTIKRYSRPLNPGKWRTLVALTQAYARQKDIFLEAFGPSPLFCQYEDHEEARDLLVDQDYTSATGLQARMWKMSLKDAFETVDREWLRLAEALQPLVMAQKNSGRFNEAQAHYAFWILTSAQRMAELVSGRAPVPTHFSLTPAELHRAVNYLRRIIQRGRGRLPRVKITRSLALDAQMYKLIETDGRQFLEVMTQVPRQRLVIPLTGRGKIEGNLRIVLDFEKQRVEVHRAIDLKTGQPAEGTPLAVDFGVTEVMTDSEGDTWGEGFGQILSQDSEALHRSGRSRNKLYAVKKKARQQHRRAKAHRLHKFNLGKKKQRRQRRKMRANLGRVINTAMNQLWQTKQPQLIIHENLRNLGGKFKSKRLSRLVSLWTHGLIKDRLQFKASLGRSQRQQTTPAYSSQRCPECGFIHPRNRKGDVFKCLFCQHGGASDSVAAWNLLEFGLDPELASWMPKEQVKALLLSRFRRRLESWDFDFPLSQANLAVLAEVGIEIPATVPGPDLSHVTAKPLMDGGKVNQSRRPRAKLPSPRQGAELNLHGSFV